MLLGALLRRYVEGDVEGFKVRAGGGGRQGGVQATPNFSVMRLGGKGWNGWEIHGREAPEGERARQPSAQRCNQLGPT